MAVPLVTTLETPADTSTVEPSTRLSTLPLPAPRLMASAPKTHEPGVKARLPSGQKTARGGKAARIYVESAGPLELCANRNFFVRPYCIQRQCDDPRFKARPECLSSRQVARARHE